MRRRVFILSILPFLHFCGCVLMAVNLDMSFGSWGWFPVFVLDFPFSVLLMPLLHLGDSFGALGQRIYPLAVFGTLGTAWWFLLSRMLVIPIVQFFSERIVKFARWIAVGSERTLRVPVKV